MIGLPFNDWACLATISQEIARMVEARDPVLVELTTRFPTTEALVEYFRRLPQRDDLGASDDGPRIDACVPSQRLRIGASDPNCVERAATFIGAAELLDAGPTYQLATVNTEAGPHTLPLVNGKPILLDPQVSPECVECGLALESPGPVAVSPRNALTWATQLATSGAQPLRNGPSMMGRARNAITRLVDRGVVPNDQEIDAMGLLFALAERAASRYGTRAIAIVRTAARAIADMLDAVLANRRRNVAVRVGGLNFETPQWADRIATALGRVGLDLGSMALRSKLGTYGVGADVIGLVEANMNKEGLTLGAFARPPELATFARFAAPRTG